MDSVKVDTVREVDAPQGPKRKMRRAGDRWAPHGPRRGLERKAALARARLLVEQGATIADASRATGLPISSLHRHSAEGGWQADRAALAGLQTRKVGGAFDLAGAKETYRAKAVVLGQRMLAGLESLDLTVPDTLWEAIPAFATLQRAMGGLLGLTGGEGGAVTIAGRNVLVVQGDAADSA